MDHPHDSPKKKKTVEACVSSSLINFFHTLLSKKEIIHRIVEIGRPHG